MVKKPFFSIVIPTYNRATDLQFALFCIFRQSFSDFEIVISDNCSTDDTEALVSKLKDKRIRYSKTNKTLGNALNMSRAIKQAEGKFIFLHSDDDFLPYEDSLKKIHTEIVERNLGYVRLNYLSLSIDKKRIFFYKVSKPFVENEYVVPSMENKKVLSFILDSEPYFISGIIFKNVVPGKIKMVDSDPSPWIEILFYVIKKYGGCFLVKPHIIASWSRRERKKNEEHHIFTLINGKLRSENYLNAVRKKISKEDYQTFLHSELLLLYVRLFPAIKFNIGNKKMLQMSERICFLDPGMKRSIVYWIYLIGALLFPRFILKWSRDTYLYFYSVFNKVPNHKEMGGILKKLEKEYLLSKKGVKPLKKPIFNFG